ncbi:uncharacterized protein KY384_001778 [Bacidia gigantensis]|uniref:uncharacterized protein n=1 Tax=Bacidia gigantensis TaxID=2732470 RepID=UPI001D046255|nr:uncharacterized protein KY384_001778 [Bacidia gigantensis]KAG8532996.1 hypothetical protein KY384_001778 [Bacidia gigantensis]
MAAYEKPSDFLLSSPTLEEFGFPAASPEQESPKEPKDKQKSFDFNGLSFEDIDAWFKESSGLTPADAPVQADEVVRQTPNVVRHATDTSQQIQDKSMPIYPKLISSSNYDFNLGYPLAQEAPTCNLVPDQGTYDPFTDFSVPQNTPYPISPPNPFLEFPKPFALPSEQLWSSSSNSLFQNNFGNITPANRVPSSLDNPYYNFPSNPDLVSFPTAGAYPNPQDYSLCSYPASGTKRAQTGHPDAQPLSKKARRATIKNYLARQEQQSYAPVPAMDNVNSYDQYIPTGVVTVPPVSEADPYAVAMKMKQMKKERQAWLKFQEASEGPEEHFNGDRKRKTSGPKIQARRHKHPGRKITVPQTADVIKRNETRRLRYYNSLTPERQREYMRTHPGVIKVSEADVKYR